MNLDCLLISEHFSSKINSHKGAISPYPASDYIEISIPENTNHTLNGVVETGQVKVQIFNMLGIEVAQTPSSVINGQTRASDLLKIDISHLPVGIYFIKIGDRVEKFVKIPYLQLIIYTNRSAHI